MSRDGSSRNPYRDDPGDTGNQSELPCAVFDQAAAGFDAHMRSAIGR